MISVLGSLYGLYTDYHKKRKAEKKPWACPHGQPFEYLGLLPAQDMICIHKSSTVN